MNAWLAPSLVNITVFQLVYQAYYAQYIDININYEYILHYFRYHHVFFTLNNNMSLRGVKRRGNLVPRVYPDPFNEIASLRSQWQDKI